MSKRYSLTENRYVATMGRQCHICDKHYFDKSTLNRHINKCHGNKKLTSNQTNDVYNEFKEFLKWRSLNKINDIKTLSSRKVSDAVPKSKQRSKTFTKVKWEK